MNQLIIKNTTIVNEGQQWVGDVWIRNDRIEKMAPVINNVHAFEINGEGLHLLPGVIDDQVHFREPGLTHKATIYSESRAAVAGGITSFMDMPNTIPNTLSLPLLEEKYQMAARSSFANYSFFMGINQDNLEEALKIDDEWVCGLTDDGLYFNADKGIMANHPEYLEKLFARSTSLIALHCEDDDIIHKNYLKFKALFGDQIPISAHPLIRSEEACFKATKRVVDLAKKHQNRLHIFHLSTAAETLLLDDQLPIAQKKITAEACVHHLWFSDEEYDKLGAWIKWNPAIKKVSDRDGLFNGLQSGKVDIIATDHAPHTLVEKSGKYAQALSGGPLVQHALPAMLTLVKQGKLTLTDLVKYMSHHVAEAYKIIDRGYIREGYFADLVLVDLQKDWKVKQANILYECGWSPFMGTRLEASVQKTFVNGQLVYNEGVFNPNRVSKRLQFAKHRI